jgi:hypothetical protein
MFRLATHQQSLLVRCITVNYLVIAGGGSGGDTRGGGGGAGGYRSALR